MQVTLRALEQEDLRQLRDWRNSDWLRPYIREHRLLNMVNQHDWFETISRDQTCAMFGIARDDRGPRRVGGSLQMSETDLAGVCGLTHISWVNRTAEVSIYIEPQSRGAGAGEQTLELLRTKAFKDFNLHRIWAEIFANNEASVALFEKAGYIREGTLGEHVFKGGRYWDSYIYGLVVDDESQD